MFRITGVAKLPQRPRKVGKGCQRRSHRQLGVPPPQPRPVHGHADVRADDGYVPREPGDGAEEVPEEDEYAVELDTEADERPPHEDEQEAAEEGGRALEFLFPREEERRLCRADDDCQADEEEDLVPRGQRGTCLGGRWSVA